MLSGEARVRIADGGDLRVSAGASVVLRPGETLEVEFEPAGRDDWDGVPPLRALFARWAPNGDRSYPARDSFLVEPMPEPPAGASLPKDVSFFP